MVGSNFGKLFKLTTWGESHGKALGCVIEGVPSNIKLTESYIQKFLDRRKPDNLNLQLKEKKKIK